MCLQETHWDTAAIAIWETLFPTAAVVAAPATQGPRGGPQGGVAVLLPAGLTLQSRNTLAAGAGIEVVAADPTGQTRRYVSLYLPPGQQRQTLDILVRTLRWTSTATVACGDFNLQLEAPRDGE